MLCSVEEAVPMPTIVSYTDLRANLATYIDEALDSRAPITVTRQGRGNVVIISQEEYEGLEETVHLLRSPANAERLRRSIADADAGKVEEHKLVGT
jgi:antitoxin YefM